MGTTFAHGAAVRAWCATSLVPLTEESCGRGIDAVPLLRAAVDDANHIAHAVFTAVLASPATSRAPVPPSLQQIPGKTLTPVETASTLGGREPAPSVGAERTRGGTDCVPVTVLTGVPGAGKARVSASIVALTADTVQWLVLRTDLAAGIDFNAAKLHDQLAAAVASVDTDRGRSGARRVLVVTVGYTPVAAVVRAIEGHPDAAVRVRVRVAAVACCVDPVCCVLADRRLLPHVLEQCALGVCVRLHCFYVGVYVPFVCVPMWLHLLNVFVCVCHMCVYLCGCT